MDPFLAGIPIVDAHHHLWDLHRNHYPWLSDRINPHFFLGDYAALRRNYLPDDYRRDAAEHHVVATVHVEAEWDRAGQVDETRWLHGIADAHGMPHAVVAHAWFDDPRVEQVLEAHAAFPRVRGIRSKPARPGQAPGDEDEARGAMRDRAWRRGYALLAKYGFSWDLRVPLPQLAEAAALVGDHPDIPVVLNHTGFPWDRGDDGLALWRKNMRLLAERPNACVKLSELGLRNAPWDYEDNRRIVLEAIEIFGARRCMFASNFPVAGLRIGFDALFTAYKRMVADFTRDAQRALFHDNAARFYRIDTGASAAGTNT